MAEPVKKKKRKAPEEDAGDGADPFVVQFTALTMILLAFFIMLNSMARIDDRRKLAALGSLIGSFGIMPEGTGLDREGEYVPNRHPIMSGVNHEQYMRAIGSLFEGMDSSGKYRVKATSTKVVLTVQSDFLFPSGITEVNPAAFPILDDVCRALLILNMPVQIEGHTDSLPGKTPVDNWRISVNRAISVLRYLNEGCAVPAKQLSAAGFADTRPANGAKKAIGAIHRRVEIIVTAPLEVVRG